MIKEPAFTMDTNNGTAPFNISTATEIDLDNTSAFTSMATSITGFTNSTHSPVTSVFENGTGYSLVSSAKNNIAGCVENMSCDSNALMDNHLVLVADFMMVIFGPVILILGVIGNSMALVVLYQPNMNMPTCTYLSSLAVADMLFLMVSLITWIISASTGGIMYITNYINCNVLDLLNHFPATFSSNLLIAISFERFAVLYFPHKKTMFSTKKKARLIVGIMAIVSLLENWHLLGGLQRPSNAEDDTIYLACVGVNQVIAVYHLAFTQYIDSVYYCYIPAIFIMIFNTLIIRKLYIRSRTVHAVQDTPIPGTSNAQNTHPKTMLTDISNRTRIKQGNKQAGNISTDNQGKILNIGETSSKSTSVNQVKKTVHQKTYDRITIMAITVTFTFIILTFPVCILLYFIPEDFHSPQFPVIYLIGTIFNLVMHINHCINIFLYCITGQKFRQTLATKLCCLKNIG